MDTAMDSLVTVAKILVLWPLIIVMVLIVVWLVTLAVVAIAASPENMSAEPAQTDTQSSQQIASDVPANRKVLRNYMMKSEEAENLVEGSRLRMRGRQRQHYVDTLNNATLRHDTRGAREDIGEEKDLDSKQLASEFRLGGRPIPNSEYLSDRLPGMVGVTEGAITADNTGIPRNWVLAENPLVLLQTRNYSDSLADKLEKHMYSHTVPDHDRLE